MKSQIDASATSTFEEAMEDEARAQHIVYTTKDMQEGITVVPRASRTALHRRVTPTTRDPGQGDFDPATSVFMSSSSIRIGRPDSLSACP